MAINTASASPLFILLAGNNVQRLPDDLGVTAKISLATVALSMPLGILFRLFMTRKDSVTKLSSRVYLGLIRIMPQFVLLFLVFFGSACVFGLSLSGEFSSIFVLVLWGTAEVRDLARDALESIPRYQYESVAVLGLTPGQYSRYVIIPQTLRWFLPLVISLVTRMIKTTSLAVLVDVVEALKTGQQIIDANRFQYPTVALPTCGVIFLLYFLVCRSVSMLACYLEKCWVV